MTSVTLHGVTDTLSPQYEKYATALETAAAAFKDAEALFNDPDYVDRVGWKVDTENDEGDVVYSKFTPKGKMVTISTELDLDVDSVMNETWTGVEGLPEWNPNINFAKTIASPTPHFDIITYGNNDVLIVSGRDFVSARMYRKTSNGYIMASRSVSIKEYPEVKGKVRAELMLAGAQFMPHPEKEDVTKVNVVMLADLKGLLPKILVNQMLGRIMLMDTEENRKHYQSIRDRRENKENKENNLKS
ncbi:START domain protein [Oesophagostomum dentatum]|uniref:START domain protein n=1 Tax=Oesophagostomum dentatum TaxID=61180 RepID=A0A0B1T9P3_OESDE|nr:START domain protein [Oesophagostomum dentatum]